MSVEKINNYPYPSSSEERVLVLNYIVEHPDEIITFGQVASATGLMRNRVRSLIDMMLIEGWFTRKIEVYFNNNYIRYSYKLAEGVKIR